VEFTVNRLELKNVLDRVAAAVPRKGNFEILSHIHLDAFISRLEMRATDLRIHARVQCPIESEIGGSVSIPADKLRGIVDNVGSEMLSMRLKEGLVMEIAGDTRKYWVSCLDADGYPAWNWGSEVSQHYLAPGVLPGFFNAVSHAASRNEQKMNLCGIHLVSEGLKMTAAATDGHRLSLASREVFNVDGVISPGIIVPLQACELTSGINAGINLDLANDSNSIQLYGGGLELVVRLIDGQFPDFRRVIPANLDKGITVDGGELLDAVKACGVMIDDEYKTVRLAVADESLTVSALSPQGVASASLPCMGDEGMKVNLNSRHLSQAIKSLPAGEIFIKFKDAQSPIMIIPLDHGAWDERIEILMPLRGGIAPAAEPDPEAVIEGKEVVIRSVTIPEPLANEHGVFVDCEHIPLNIWKKSTGNVIHVVQGSDGGWRSSINYSFAESGGGAFPSVRDFAFDTRNDAVLDAVFKFQEKLKGLAGSYPARKKDVDRALKVLAEMERELTGAEIKCPKCDYVAENSFDHTKHLRGTHNMCLQEAINIARPDVVNPRPETGTVN